MTREEAKKPCEDAVSRDAVRNCFNGFVKMDKDTLPYVEDYLKTVMRRINELPSVTQKSDNKYRKEAKRWKNKWLKSQKSGKWIERQNIARTSIATAIEFRWTYECSKCGYEVRHKTRYCASCGADMRGAE